ncbi:DNA cytosine methyltransferase [Pseudomonas entomophila]|uniref:DNA cytosine methyltransferase n=1 Tax=Pseudomonas entomophila TaxID=312306 RepID=UPI0015E27CD3|nr:DNA cytosine methyltransferase [Pseudomonas entomophila]MBA1187935.1 DNA cytosine methyltransferase [Pseudomonas entomophila]
MPAYYNEIDIYAAQWLRNLIAAGHIAPGDVDERSIEDVHPDDLKPYTQCHFFAGVGVWSYALRRAGWPDDRPIWTGSCPCQPFSAAGAGAGFDDQRHLWPHFHWLIRERQPSVVFGEQVASKDADPWLDLVQADVEAMAYAFGAVAFPSAGVGAPHIRDRTYWVAHAHGSTGRKRGAHLRRRPHGSDAQSWSGPGGSGLPGGMADSHGQRKGPGRDTARITDAGRVSTAVGLAKPNGLRFEQKAVAGLQDTEHNAESRGSAERLADPQRWDAPEPTRQWSRSRNTPLPGPSGQPQGCCALSDARPPSPVNGLWADADWLFCRDGKWRPVEPGTSPLAHGAPSRVGRLRAYGNAINAEAAAHFIAAYLETL